jgi:hypothetical protein
MEDAETGEVFLGKKMVHLSKVEFGFSMLVQTALGAAALAGYVVAKNGLVRTDEKSK